MLPERYTYIRTLGEGAWGKVSLAEDMQTGSRVAVKSIALDDSIDRELLDSEIQTLKNLDHPHIVRFLDASINEERIHIVTEYIEGKTLDAHLADGELSLDRLRRYGDQILDALGHVHDRGVIHSDLKPENIIIDTADNCRLIDFGIVRTASAEIAADIKEIRGTLHYMSPEQAEGNPYDIRSDLFSFGVVLYEMCTRKKPFDGEYDMAVVYAILYEEPVPPHKINPEINEDLSALVLDLLAKASSDRPPSAGIVRKRLAGIQAVMKDPDTAAGNRLAILPIEYPTGDDDSQVIAEGVQDELYARLKGFGGLDLVSPVKVRQHLNKLAEGRAVRNLLGADTYITGRIRKSSSQIRVYFMHINSSSDQIIWSEKYDAPLSDLFDIIDMITEKVLPGLQMTLTGVAEPKTAATTTTRPEAYQLYLLARNYYIKNTRKDIDYAKQMFGEALRFDKDYALALVGLADCFCTEYMNYLDRRPETIQKAEEYAQRARRQGPDLPEVYRSLGRIKQTIGQVKDAAANYLKAVTYREDYYEAYRSLAWLAKDCFRYNEAQQWIRKALSIDASDLETIFLSGVVHFEKKESKLAVNDFTRGLELRPDYGRAHFFRGMTYCQFGRIDSAIKDMVRAVELGGDINAPYILGYYYLVRKDFEAAERSLKAAAENSEIAFIARHYLGLTCMLSERGDARECFTESMQLCRDALNQEPDLIIAKAILAQNLAFLDADPDECHRLLSEVSNYIVNDGAMAHELARAYAILGDRKKTEKYVALAIETHQGPTESEISLDPILRHYRRR